MVSERGSTAKQAIPVRGLFSLFRPGPPKDELGTSAKLDKSQLKSKPISVPRKLLASLGLGVREKRSAPPTQSPPEVPSTNASGRPEYQTNSKGRSIRPLTKQEEDVRRGSAYEARPMPTADNNINDSSEDDRTEARPSSSGVSPNHPNRQSLGHEVNPTSTAGLLHALSKKDPKLSPESSGDAKADARRDSRCSSSYASTRASPLLNEAGDDEPESPLLQLRSSLAGQAPRSGPHAMDEVFNQFETDTVMTRTCHSDTLNDMPRPFYATAMPAGAAQCESWSAAKLLDEANSACMQIGSASTGSSLNVNLNVSPKVDAAPGAAKEAQDFFFPQIKNSILQITESVEATEGVRQAPPSSLPLAVLPQTTSPDPTPMVKLGSSPRASGSEVSWGSDTKLAAMHVELLHTMAVPAPAPPPSTPLKPSPMTQAPQLPLDPPASSLATAAEASSMKSCNSAATPSPHEAQTSAVVRTSPTAAKRSLPPTPEDSEALAKAALPAPASPRAPEDEDPSFRSSAKLSFRVGAPQAMSRLSGACVSGSVLSATRQALPAASGSAGSLGIFTNLVHSRQSSQQNLVQAASQQGGALAMSRAASMEPPAAAPAPVAPALSLAPSHEFPPVISPSDGSPRPHPLAKGLLASQLTAVPACIAAPPPASAKSNRISISDTKKAQKAAYESQLADQITPPRLSQLKGHSPGGPNEHRRRAPSRCTTQGSLHAETSLGGESTCSSQDGGGQMLHTERMGSMLRVKLRHLVADQVEGQLRRQQTSGNNNNNTPGGHGRATVPVKWTGILGNQAAPKPSPTPAFSMDWTRSPLCNPATSRPPVQQPTPIFIAYRCALHGVQSCPTCLAATLPSINPRARPSPPAPAPSRPPPPARSASCLGPSVDPMALGGLFAHKQQQCQRIEESDPFPAEFDLHRSSESDLHRSSGGSEGTGGNCSPTLVAALNDLAPRLAVQAAERRPAPTRTASCAVIGSSAKCVNNRPAPTAAEQVREMKNIMQQADLNDLLLKFSKAKQGKRRSSVMTMFEPHNRTLSEREQHGGHEGAVARPTTARYGRQGSSQLC